MKDRAPPVVMLKSWRSMPPLMENVSALPSGSVAVAVKKVPAVFSATVTVPAEVNTGGRFIPVTGVLPPLPPPPPQATVANASSTIAPSPNRLDLAMGRSSAPADSGPGIAQGSCDTRFGFVKAPGAGRRCAARPCPQDLKVRAANVSCAACRSAASPFVVVKRCTR